MTVLARPAGWAWYVSGAGERAGDFRKSGRWERSLGLGLWYRAELWAAFVKADFASGLLLRHDGSIELIHGFGALLPVRVENVLVESRF